MSKYVSVERVKKIMESLIAMRKDERYTLGKTDLNLWTDIRKDVFDYFEKNNIEWSKKPSADLLSSQIACINHLFPLRKREDMSTALLKNIDSRIKKAIKIDGGFVEFNIVGKENYFLGRGWQEDDALITTLDAIMVGEREDGKNVLFVFEWKYTKEVDDKDEPYTNEGSIASNEESISSMGDDKDELSFIEKNSKEVGLLLKKYFEEDEKVEVIYALNRRLFKKIFQCLSYYDLQKTLKDQLRGIEKRDPFPIIVNVKNKKVFDFNNELFYQLLKQTLLAFNMVVNKEYNCDEYIHLRIIPKKNNQLRDACKKWKRLLTYPEEYKVFSPQDLFKPLEQTKDISDLIAYLKKRYW